jgi:acetamidase/formamidase
VEGAEPGDTLAIEIVAMETRGWGYTLIIPGFGLLPDDFPDPYIRVFDLTNGEFAYLREDMAAQDAVRAMVDHVAGEYDLSREDAYVLSSLCVDLRISEVVDAGQYVVSALLPLAVLTPKG